MTVGAGLAFLRVNDNNLVKIPIANLDFIKKPVKSREKRISNRKDRRYFIDRINTIMIE